MEEHSTWIFGVDGEVLSDDEFVGDPQSTRVAMLVLLLAAAFLPWGSSNLCPTALKKSLIQEYLVPRPEGEFVLTCSINGMFDSEIEYFMWVVEEIDSSIYEYSGPQQVDRMSPGTAYFAKGVTRNISKTGFESQLTLVLNVTSKNTYRCQFTIYPSSICHEVITIQFQDPAVSLSFVQNSKQELNNINASLIDAVCSVDASMGTPTFELSYNGTDMFRIVKEERRIETIGYYQNGSYLTTLIIPHSGVVVCTVSDLLGTYTARKRVPVPPIPSSSTLLVGIVVFLVVGLILVAAFLIFIYRKRRKRTRSLIAKDPVIPEVEIFKRYFSNDWDWKRIAELSDNPVLYEGDGPSTSDVQQWIDVDDDSWFLASLNSLCLAYTKGHWQEFHVIFDEAQDLKGAEIPIKLWRYGKWKTIYVTPTLPTKEGKLCFMHSSNKNVFWSALLQKAYVQEYVTYSGLDGERDVHILEDLTGGVVRNYKNNDYQQESRILYSALNLLNKTAIVLTWKTSRAESNGFVFYSVINVHEKGTKVSYRVFLPADGDFDDSYDSPMQFVDLFSAPDEYNLLFKDTDTESYTCLKSFSGKWKHSQDGDNYRNDLFWINPQYLLGFHGFTDDHRDLVQICLAVIQRDTADRYSTTETLPRPLKIGLNSFRITDETFTTMNALAIMHPGIRPDRTIRPRYTREVRGWWTIPINERLIIVPTVEGGQMPADFLFRVFTDKPHITIVEELPHAD